MKTGKESRKQDGFQYTPTQMLNTVLLLHEIKDLGHIRAVVTQSFKIVLSDELADHLLKQNIHVPAAPTVYRHRLFLDLATMVFSGTIFWQ